MVTLKNLVEKPVICGQMEVEKATHKCLYDINILAAWEEVTALKLSVHIVRKQNVQLATVKWARETQKKGMLST